MLSRLVKAISSRLRRRNAQEEIDALRTCLLLDYRRHTSAEPYDASGIESLDFDEHQRRAAADVHAQLVHMFEAVNKDAAEVLAAAEAVQVALCDD